MTHSFKFNWIATWLLIMSLSSEAFAIEKAPIFDREKQNSQTLSEFIYGDELEQKLIPVFLLGEVQRPGIYHVPLDTTLTTLVSIAGGMGANSEIQDISIRNERDSKIEKVNFESVIAGSHKAPILRREDTVFIPTMKPTISNNTLVTVTVAATLLTAVLTGILIKKAL